MTACRCWDPCAACITCRLTDTSQTQRRYRANVTPTTTWVSIKNLLDDLEDFIEETIKDTGDVIEGTWDGLGNLIKETGDVIEDAWDSVVDYLDEIDYEYDHGTRRPLPSDLPP